MLDNTQLFKIKLEIKIIQKHSSQKYIWCILSYVLLLSKSFTLMDITYHNTNSDHDFSLSIIFFKSTVHDIY